MDTFTQLKVRLILYDRGKILLLRQTKPNGGNYSLVGGTVEAKEFARSALIREAYEEAGIQLAAKNLILVHVMHKHLPGGKHRMTLYFKARKWSGRLQAREQHKFTDVEWFDLDQLPKNLTGTVAHVLKCYRNGIFYSEMTKT